MSDDKKEAEFIKRLRLDEPFQGEGWRIVCVEPRNTVREPWVARAAYHDFQFELPPGPEYERFAFGATPKEAMLECLRMCAADADWPKLTQVSLNQLGYAVRQLSSSLPPLLNARA